MARQMTDDVCPACNGVGCSKDSTEQDHFPCHVCGWTGKRPAGYVAPIREEALSALHNTDMAKCTCVLIGENNVGAVYIVRKNCPIHKGHI